MYDIIMHGRRRSPGQSHERLLVCLLLLPSFYFIFYLFYATEQRRSANRPRRSVIRPFQFARHCVGYINTITNAHRSSDRRSSRGATHTYTPGAPAGPYKFHVCTYLIFLCSFIWNTYLTYKDLSSGGCLTAGLTMKTRSHAPCCCPALPCLASSPPWGK